MDSLDRHSAKIIIRRRTLRPALGALLLSCAAVFGEPAEVVQAPLEYGEGEITLDNNATGQALSLPPADTGKPLINLLGFRTMPPSQSVEASDANHFWGAFRIANTREGVFQP